MPGMETLYREKQRGYYNGALHALMRAKCGEDIEKLLAEYNGYIETMKKQDDERDAPILAAIQEQLNANTGTDSESTSGEARNIPNLDWFKCDNPAVSCSCGNDGCPPGHSSR